MRIPYVPNPPEPTTAEDAAIVARIAARRAPRPLQPLDLALLHAPAVADGWNAFLGAVRTKTTALAADLRELAVSRVAVVNHAWYEWGHHAPLAAQAGVSAAGLDVAKLDGPLSLDRHDELLATPAGQPAPLSETQWAVLVYTDEMTRSVTVADATFARLRELFDERQIVELTAVIACYNCVSRFLVALDVGERNGTGPDATH
ncbi:4-carboxymuconolactone decarboxylase family protein [Grosmannia clavigera kw1407]|uniref:4-carboxymuconolactone decarboxylase family protein n=1 Tax=Grosmannia clavigera (strain kw1407 / UAMH 11150) TaxID=655863 RepID=F0XCN9_GROCL|nr:4-carboxymuconolactone decarboxylase family protein [Grosmannia clavigera kw1407]EFX04277.1 4-carboxymuconolactone decarboxylase family protein [Grosmannia clavigera kw1407]